MFILSTVTGQPVATKTDSKKERVKMNLILLGFYLHYAFVVTVNMASDGEQHLVSGTVIS